MVRRGRDFDIFAGHVFVAPDIGDVWATVAAAFQLKQNCPPTVTKGACIQILIGFSECTLTHALHQRAGVHVSPVTRAQVFVSALVAP